MPVNMDVINSVIGAYNQGYQQQLQKQGQAQQAKEAADRLSEQQREFDLTHAATKALNDLEIQRQTQALKSGIYNAPNPQALVPNGATPDTESIGPTGENYTVYNHPSLGKIVVPTVPYRAAQAAQESSITNAPAVAAKEEEAKLLQQEEGQRQLANQKEKDEAAAERAFEERDAKLERQRNQDQTMMALATMNNGSKQLIARIGADSRENAARIRNDFAVSKVSEGNRDKFNMLGELEDKANELKRVLDASGYSYYGGSGLKSTGNEIMKNFAGHENVQLRDKTGQPIINPDTNSPYTLKDIRTKSGELNSMMAQERFKSRFTDAERQQLGTYIPGQERTEAPDSVQSKLNSLIPTLRKQQMDLMKTSPGLNSTSSTIRVPGANATANSNTTRPPLESFGVPKVAPLPNQQ